MKYKKKQYLLQRTIHCQFQSDLKWTSRFVINSTAQGQIMLDLIFLSCVDRIITELW